MHDTVAPTVKTALLRAHDLAMMGRAARYDLSAKPERTRSCADLTQLFFSLADILEVDLFVECGAKDASASRRARRRLDPQRIVAFEANPFTYKRFKSDNADPALGVEYLHRALSDKPGDVTMHVRRTANGRPRADGQASLLERVDEIEKGFVEVTVEATTVDAFFAEHAYERAALWVDVEGASQQVLTGAGGTLDKTAVLIIEVEDRAMWGAGQWLRGDVLSRLYDRGLVPVARDFQSRYQYNVVLVRDELLDHDRVRWALTHFQSAAGSRPPRQSPDDGGAARAGNSDDVRSQARALVGRAKARARRYRRNSR